jgi:hypothetical protein
VHKTLTLTNYFLIFLTGFLLIQCVRVWVQPKYPARVDGNALTGASKDVQQLEIDRKPSPIRATGEIATKNLFRKQRSDYKAPVQVAQATPKINKTPIPPPDLKLKGVILLDGTKIALLEGNYSVREGDNAVKNKPIKRKGYFLGSQVGTYHLTNIEKNLVVLDDSQGGKLELKLADRPADKVILRQGNSLVQNNKSFSPKELKAAPPSRRPPPAPVVKKNNPEKTANKKPKRTFRVSGASTNTPTTHISGN